MRYHRIQMDSDSIIGKVRTVNNSAESFISPTNMAFLCNSHPPTLATMRITVLA